MNAGLAAAFGMAMMTAGLFLLLVSVGLLAFLLWPRRKP